MTFIWKDLSIHSTCTNRSRVSKTLPTSHQSKSKHLRLGSRHRHAHLSLPRSPLGVLEWRQDGEFAGNTRSGRHNFGHIENLERMATGLFQDSEYEDYPCLWWLRSSFLCYLLQVLDLRECSIVSSLSLVGVLMVFY